MNRCPFEPSWYMEQSKQQLAELERDPRLTWKHPADWMLAIGLATVLACLFLGVFR